MKPPDGVTTFWWDYGSPHQAQPVGTIQIDVSKLYEARILALEARVADLEARLARAHG